MSAGKITPEQLRKEAVAVERMHGETLTVDWRTKQANQLRAHAAALEQVNFHKISAETYESKYAAMRERAERAEAKLAKLRQHAEANERLLAFRDYFADKCEGLFFQFGMEVIDLYNATHGSEVFRIEPDRADFPEGTR